MLYLLVYSMLYSMYVIYCYMKDSMKGMLSMRFCLPSNSNSSSTQPGIGPRLLADCSIEPSFPSPAQRPLEQHLRTQYEALSSLFPLKT